MNLDLGGGGARNGVGIEELTETMSSYGYKFKIRAGPEALTVVHGEDKVVFYNISYIEKLGSGNEDAPVYAIHGTSSKNAGVKLYHYGFECYIE